MPQAGIPVAISSDNVRDQFYAYGDLDMLEVFTQASHAGVEASCAGVEPSCAGAACPSPRWPQFAASCGLRLETVMA